MLFFNIFMIKLKKALFLVLSLVFVQSIAFANSGSSNSKIPNPIDLKYKWHQLFDENLTDFDTNSEKFVNKLRRVSSNLTPKQQQIAEKKIFKIEKSLKKLKKLKNTTVISQKVEKYKEEKKYTLNDIFSISENLYLSRNILLNQTAQVKIDENEIDGLYSKLDDLWDNYKDAPDNTFEKINIGLDLIYQRLSLEIEKTSKSILKKRIENQKQMIGELKVTASDISNNLDFSKNLDINIDSKIDENEKTIINLDKELQNLLHQDLKNSEKRQKILQKSLQKEKVVLENVILNTKKTFYLLYQKQIDAKEALLVIKEEKKIVSLSSKNLKAWQESSKYFFRRSLNENQDEKNKLYLIKEGSASLAYESLKNLQQVEKNIFIASFFVEQLNDYVHENYATFWMRVKNVTNDIFDFFEEHVSFFKKPLFRMGTTPISVNSIIFFFVIIFIFYYIAKIIRRYIRRLGVKHHHGGREAFYSISKLVFYLVFVLGIVVALVFIGFDFTALAVIIGALSVGLGFGLQTIFNDFISGILVLVEKNIRIGDVIQLESGDIGKVVEINVRTTLIKTFDNLEVLVPNSQLISKKFINWTLSEETRRLKIPFSVAYGTDVNNVKQKICESAKKVAVTIKEKEPQVWLVNLGDNGLEFQLVVWINEYIDDKPPETSKVLYLYEIEKTLKENNIEIPYPVRDIILRKNEEEK
jgi:potassium-dependent mechanosensitive channel